MPANFRPLFAAAALVAALAACDDPYSIEAQNAVVADTTVLYSINDAPIGAPTAYFLFGAVNRTTDVTANSSFNFDVALSIPDANQVQLITPRRLVGVIPNLVQPPHRVGLQTVPEAFDQLLAAPNSGFAYDSLLTVTPGQAVVIQSANPNACPLAIYGMNFYAKFVVDSIRMDPARAFVRVTTDPNCDFRSFAPGVPKE